MAVGMVTLLDAAHLGGPPECNDRVVRAELLEIKSHVIQQKINILALKSRATLLSLARLGASGTKRHQERMEVNKRQNLSVLSSASVYL